ncbi:MAG: energy transducer TonB [Steroidobacteraceae bacterium]
MAHPAPSESRDSASEGAAPSVTPSGAQRPADLAALTTRDDFLLELGEILGGRASVHPADSLDVAIEHLEGARGRQILAIDARETGDVRANVERAAGRVGAAKILVFTEAGTEKTVAAAVKGTRVFAVLTLPMQTGKTSAVIDAALSDPEAGDSSPRAPRPAPRRVIPEHSGSQTPATGNVRPEEPAGGHGKLIAATLGVLVVALGAGALWWLMRTHPAAVAPARTERTAAVKYAAPARPKVDTSIVRGRVSELLIKASRAMFERHFTAPKGANALVYYRSVLAVDPTNAEARNGLQRVANVLVSRFGVDLSRHRYAGAALALATLQLAEPDNTHIGAFRIRLASARVEQALSSKGTLAAAPALIAQALRWGVPAAQIKAWQAQLATLRHGERVKLLAQRLERRISAGRLIGAHSAESALAKLRALAPQAARTGAAAQALIGALIGQARQAGLAADAAEQSQWLSAARWAGATPRQIDSVQQQVVRLETQSAEARLNRLLAQARARLAGGALIDPAHDSAAYYLSVIDASHPDPAQRADVNVLRDRLATALVAQAQSAARAGQRATAQADLAAARHWGAHTAVLAAATAIAAEPPAAPTPAQLAAVARQLRRIHYVAPAYPQRALASGLSGEVTVQYVVNTQGRTRQLQVINSRPGAIFNRAALRAIRRWRYSRPEFRGRPVSVPVRTEIRFVLPN